MVSRGARRGRQVERSVVLQHVSPRLCCGGATHTCFRVAHASIRCLGMPLATALAIPPISSISRIT
eukprot:scaffold15517_cov114-Isochrysis_galbana.AAC.2